MPQPVELASTTTGAVGIGAARATRRSTSQNSGGTRAATTIARIPSDGIPTRAPSSPVESTTLEKTAPADVERCWVALISDMKLARSGGAGTLLISVWYGAIRKFIPTMKR